MSVLNRSMFNKQIVNREMGSPPQGEQPSTTFFQKLFDGATGLGTGVGPYGDKEQGNILDLREYGAGVYDINDPQFVEFIKNYLRKNKDSTCASNKCCVNSIQKKEKKRKRS